MPNRKSKFTSRAILAAYLSGGGVQHQVYESRTENALKALHAVLGAALFPLSSRTLYNKACGCDKEGQNILKTTNNFTNVVDI